MSAQNVSPAVDTHQIMAAGLASTGAAFVTSRFGVAGTLLGAALTAMIITGASAVLRAYIANASSRVRGGVTRLRDRGPGRPASAAPENGVYEPEPARQGNPPGRPDLRDNFVGRLRAAMDWFRNLPTSGRRPIIIKALVAAGIAFAICMAAVWVVEKGIGNTLSCGFWGTCSVGASPGIDPLGLNGTGARSTISGGDYGIDGGGGVIDSIRQNPAVPDGPDIVPGGADPSASPAPDAGGSASPAPESPAPEEPVEEAPSSASPAAEDGAAPDASASASPAP